MHSPAEIIFGEQALLLDARGALFWPDEQLLVVSDLHLEKGSFLAHFGSPLPRYDTRHTLQKLTALVNDYRPAHVICLGDSFHDRNAFMRLEPNDLATLRHLVTRTEQWDWVLGNHDPALSPELPGNQYAEIIKGGIALRHEPEDHPGPQIVGHFHPKLHLRLGGQRVRGPAFVHDNTTLIMPAFGSFTGGLDIQHEAIASRLRNPVCFLLYREKIWRMQLDMMTAAATE